MPKNWPPLQYLNDASVPKLPSFVNFLLAKFWIYAMLVVNIWAMYLMFIGYAFTLVECELGRSRFKHRDFSGATNLVFPVGLNLDLNEVANSLNNDARTA